MKIYIKNISFFLLSLLLLWYAFRGLEFSKIIENLKEVKYVYVIISFILGYLAYLTRAIRWRILIKSIGYESKIINSSNSVSISYFSNLIFPRAGEIVRCSTMSKLENIPMNKLFGTVILERIIDFIILFTLVLIAFMLEEESLKSFFKKIIEVRQNNGTQNYLYIWILGFLFIISVVLILLRNKIKGLEFYKKTVIFLVGVKEGIVSAKNIEKKYLFIFYTAVIWICYFLANYIVFLSFVETQHFGILEGLVLLAVGGLAMLVPVQGGIGSYHLAVKVMLSFYGISEITSISFATLVHTTQSLVALIFGGIAFIHVVFSLKKQL